MTSEWKINELSETFNPEELYNLCDDDQISCTREEAFDRIREWMNRNKDNNNRLKAALTYQGGYCNDTPLHLIETPLHEILEMCPPVDIIQTFIEYAPETLQMKNVFGELPIHRACEYEASLKVIRALVNGFLKSIKVTTDCDHLPVHLACGNHGSLEVIFFLIESYPESIKVTTYWGHLPVHLACRNQGSLEVIFFLIESYPESIKIADNHGHLPLHLACYKEVSLEVVNFLIESYPDGIDQEDQDDKTPLDYLKESEYAMGTDNKGMLPLHHACKNGYSLYLIHFLMQAHPEDLTVPDNDGKTPLQYLTATASCIDEKGMALLHRQAAHFKGLDVEILDILFHANPEAIRLRDKSSLLPIHHACLNEASSLDALMLFVKFYPESISV